jgi:hypothetical protein
VGTLHCQVVIFSIQECDVNRPGNTQEPSLQQIIIIIIIIIVVVVINNNNNNNNNAIVISSQWAHI